MLLREFAAQTKRQIFDDLFGGGSPRVGEFDASLLAQARDLGEPKMGTTHFSPHAVTHEFTYGAGQELQILRVTLTPPERIVYMPVPGWVVENIWQGSIDGTYHFASDAERLLAEFAASLGEGANEVGFGVRPTIGKD
ncbi:MAG: hypothetical protein JNJ45_08120 [Chthonomonas sp.]|nr:hypothetical protein [Chthonomonas sp.]